MSNLQPGTPVPQTGTYVCCWCGPGGLAQAIVGPTLVLEPSVTRVLNAHLRLPGSDRLTVFELTEGQTLPQCPSCADATGWDLLVGSLEDLLRSRVQGRERMFARFDIPREPLDPRETELRRLTITTDPATPPNPAPATQQAVAPCDVCGGGVASSEGYLLTTPQVLTSEAYWHHAFRVAGPQLELLPDRADQDRWFVERLRTREHDRTPWLVCDNCTEYFLADWQEAHEYVVRGKKPRGRAGSGIGSVSATSRSRPRGRGRASAAGGRRRCRSRSAVASAICVPSRSGGTRPSASSRLT